jgi:signal peptidase
MSARRAQQKERGILYYLGTGISGGVLALIIALGIAVIGLPAATGSTALTVLTRSMEPTYPPGTLVIVAPIKAQDIRLGDAITYQIESGKPDVVTHRVIAVSSKSDGSVTFVTQGDNNGAPDANPVVADQVRGKVWYSLPWIGWVNTTVSGASRGWILPVLAVVLFLYAGWMFASGMMARARRNRTRGRRALIRQGES